VVLNESEFNANVENLRDYELALMRALGDIEKVESQSVSIKDTYLTNFKDVSQITNQQSMLIDELKIIELELDKYLDG
jgi:uncharacterized protein YkvS